MGKSREDHKLKRSSSPPRGRFPFISCLKSLVLMVLLRSNGGLVYADESRSKRRRSKDDDKEHKSSKKHKSHTSSKHDSSRKGISSSLFKL